MTMSPIWNRKDFFSVLSFTRSREIACSSNLLKCQKSSFSLNTCMTEFMILTRALYPVCVCVLTFLVCNAMLNNLWCRPSPSQVVNSCKIVRQSCIRSYCNAKGATYCFQPWALVRCPSYWFRFISWSTEIVTCAQNRIIGKGRMIVWSIWYEGSGIKSSHKWLTT